MTFSDKAVADLVNRSFVAAWINRAPGFHNENYSTEQWIFTERMEAYATRNICTFFLTPEGKVFHYLAGYHAPETFAVELAFTLAVRREAFDETMAPKADGAAASRALHLRESGRIKEILSKDRSWEEAVRDFKTETYREFTHRHTAACAKAIREGELYRAALHEQWSGVQALPAFDDVRFDYVFGNFFSEEPRRGASCIRGKCVVQD